MIHRMKLKSMLALALLALGLVLLGACSSSAEKLNQDGNEAFAKEAFDEALQAYESAKIESPELAEPYYNAANALYRQEKYAEALEELQKALAHAEDQALAESSFYNMGNSSFNTQEWEAAVDAYTETLLLNPDDEDAKHNLEVALLQQQQQEQENQDQQQEQSGKGESQQDDQQEEESQSEEGDQEQEQDQPQDGDQQQEQNQSEESDQQQEQDQSQDSEQQEQQNQGQNRNQPQNEDQQNSEEPQDQNQQSGQGQPQDGQQDADEQPRPGQMPPPGQRMTEEQARQLLEAIAQDSDTLQERLGQFFFVPAGPPVQDW